MGAVAGAQPLGRLLAMALTAVIDELHERLAAVNGDETGVSPALPAPPPGIVR